MKETKNINDAINYIYEKLNEIIKENEYNYSIQFSSRLKDEKILRRFLSGINFEDAYIIVSAKDIQLITNRNDEFKEEYNSFIQDVVVKIHEKHELINMEIRIPLFYEN